MAQPDQNQNDAQRDPTLQNRDTSDTDGAAQRAPVGSSNVEVPLAEGSYAETPVQRIGRDAGDVLAEAVRDGSFNTDKINQNFNRKDLNE